MKNIELVAQDSTNEAVLCLMAERIKGADFAIWSLMTWQWYVWFFEEKVDVAHEEYHRSMVGVL
jgi:hypothetical protein